MTRDHQNDMTPHRPVAIRLPLVEWGKVIAVRVVSTAGSVWAVRSYLGGVEDRVAQAVAKAEDAKAIAKAADAKIESLKDNTSGALVKIAADVGEIKGRLQGMPTAR